MIHEIELRDRERKKLEQYAFSERLGLAIKRERLFLEMSLSELARRSHVIRQSIRDIENGRRSPSLITIVKISRALGVTIDDLVKRGKL